MKIFSIKRMLGLAAIYGAVQYARKNGGAKSAFNGLLDKAKDFASGLTNEVGSVASDASASKTASSPYASSSGIGSRSTGSESTSYGGSGSSGDGFGGNGRRGY
jgi:hypothetical protein